MAIDQLTKRCPRCKLTLPLGEFHKNKSTSDGLQCRCKKCHGETVLEAKRKRVAEGRNHPPAEKKCPSCGQVVPLSGWCRNRTSIDGLQANCKKCHGEMNSVFYRKRKERDPEWYQRSLKASQERSLKRSLKMYNLTREEYEVLLAKGCAICGKPEMGRNGLAFDHCHKTGKFRGLLCANGCNGALGMFQDSIDLLSKAIEYLKIHAEG